MSPDDPGATPPPDGPAAPVPGDGPGLGVSPEELLRRALQSRPSSGAAGPWTPPEPEALSRLLPQYRIESFLGRGGMGAVYKGRQTTLDRPVAIKLLPAEMAVDDSFIARFQREARVLARLQHPGIVAVYDFGQTGEGHLYFVMEFVDGTDLHRVLHGPGLSEEQSLEIVSQVCDALHYAHAQGVVHRDIKPANILLTADGRAKLADFGLARPLHDEGAALTQSNVVMGTPDYMAPELIYGTPDHRADLFSLGVMLYEMLTGRPPRGSWLAPSQRVQVDVRLDDVVVRALAEDPELRYQQASEIKTDVDRIRTTAPTEPEPEPAPEPVVAAPARSPSPPKAGAGKKGRQGPKEKPSGALAWTAAGVLLLAGAAATVFLISTRPSEERPEAVAAVPTAVKPAAEDSTGPTGPTGQTGQKGPTTTGAGRSARAPEAAAAVAATAGPEEVWTPFFDKPEDFREDAPLELRDGWVARKPGWQTTSVVHPLRATDSAVRAEFVEVGGRLLVRQDRSYYQLERRATSLDLILATWNPEQGKNDYRALQKVEGLPPVADQPYTLELRAVGSLLTGSLDGETLIRVEDSSLPSGRMGIGLNVLSGSDPKARRIERLILDEEAGGAPVTVQAGSTANSAASPSHSIPAEALAFEGSRYLLVKDFCTWEEAKRKAEGMGGHLATITTREEHEWMKEALSGSVKSRGRIWLGGYLDESKKWAWVTGEPWIYTAWDEGNPSGGREDKLETRGEGVNYGLWNDAVNDHDELNRYFLVEWSAPAAVQSSPVPVSPASASLPSATKDQPFANSLGMKFVPVPGTEVLFCIHETRYKDYAAFAAENPGTRNGWKGGYTVTERAEDHPVGRVSWEEAKAFCEWLSKKEGKTYRLPTDEEWSLAVGLGGKEIRSPGDTPERLSGKVEDEFPWGTSWPPPAGAGNYSDQSKKAKAPHPAGRGAYLEGYDDGFPLSAPVMSFAPNRFGLYDMGGNMAEWVEDWLSEALKERVFRGSSAVSGSRESLLSSSRSGRASDENSPSLGFRVVLAASAEPTPAPTKITDTPASPPPAPVAATKEKPFANSLGMKFVPVPGADVLFCIHETRYRDYEEYAKENPGIDGGWKNQTNDGFKITGRAGDYPVARVSREDAQAFCAWLSKREGKTYRLPTDEEWSLAVGLGGKEIRSPGDTPESLNRKVAGVYPWGTVWPPPPGAGNYADQSRKSRAPNPDPNVEYLEGYDDGFPTTSPVMSFASNPFGLYDMGGNVFEWVEDWYSNEQSKQVARGGAFYISESSRLLASNRQSQAQGTRTGNTGFRIVLAPSAEPAPAPTKITDTPATPPPAPVAATKEKPFANSLGMKFVPVPGTEVLFCIHETRRRDYAFYGTQNPDVDKTWYSRSTDGYAIPDPVENHPVKHVSWDDAKAFCEWLSKKEGKTYRLPTDEEWSLAVGLGGKEVRSPGDTPESLNGKVDGEFPWGTAWPPPQGAGNYSDESKKAKAPYPNGEGGYVEGYDDGFPATAPVMSFQPNEFGLHDMGGNVGEWVEDWFSEERKEKTLRGTGHSTGGRQNILSSAREHRIPGQRSPVIGFRVVLVPSAGPTSSPAKITAAPASPPAAPEAGPQTGAVPPSATAASAPTDIAAITLRSPDAVRLLDLERGQPRLYDSDPLRVIESVSPELAGWKFTSIPQRIDNEYEIRVDRPGVIYAFGYQRKNVSKEDIFGSGASLWENAEGAIAGRMVLQCHRRQVKAGETFKLKSYELQIAAPSIVLEKVPAIENAAPSPTVTDTGTATKDQPFVNSLGMQFVPVPGTDALFCVHETRWRDYEAYAKENPGIDDKWKNQVSSGIVIAERAGDHPVGRVSWEDAKAFCAWLSKKEGRAYRLPTDEEWSLAVGLGGKEVRSPGDTPESLNGKVDGEFPWGTAWPPPPGAGNYRDISFNEASLGEGFIEGYDDGFPTTAPVMSFTPNPFGLYDMGGNVQEWVEDWFSGERKKRTMRSNSASSAARNGSLSSMRSGFAPDDRAWNYGFRVVLVPERSPAPADPGWQPLFPDGTLDGWTGDPAGYRLGDGVLTATEKGGDLVSPEEYGSFHLAFDLRLSPGANSGIGIWCANDKQGQRFLAHTGFEIQLLDDTAPAVASAKGEQLHGSLYNFLAPQAKPMGPPGSWNRHEIRLEGTRLTVVINDVTVIDQDLPAGDPVGGARRPRIDFTKKRGHLVFCGAKGPVDFRNVRIKDLDSPSASPPSPIQQRLTELRAAYETAYRNGVGQTHDAAVADLDAKYLAALDRALAAAAQGNDLDGALALRDERQRVESGQPPPADDSGAAPALQALRRTYRSALADLEVQRDQQAAPLEAQYRQALEAYQIELTRSGDLDGALAVKKVIEALQGTP